MLRAGSPKGIKAAPHVVSGQNCQVFTHNCHGVITHTYVVTAVGIPPLLNVGESLATLFGSALGSGTTGSRDFSSKLLNAYLSTYILVSIPRLFEKILHWVKSISYLVCRIVNIHVFQ